MTSGVNDNPASSSGCLLCFALLCFGQRAMKLEEPPKLKALAQVPEHSSPHHNLAPHQPPWQVDAKSDRSVIMAA